MAEEAEYEAARRKSCPRKRQNDDDLDAKLTVRSRTETDMHPCDRPAHRVTEY